MNRIIVQLLLLMSWATPVFAADVSGTWNLEVAWHESQSQSTGVCRLTQNGSRLSGSCGSEKSRVSGEIRDSRLSWHVDVNEADARGQMVFEGQLDDAGTAIKGTCHIVGGQDGSFTMKKQ